MDTLHHEAEAATEEYNAATEAAREARRRLDQLTDRAARATERLNGARQEIGTRAAAEYRSGLLSPTLSLALHSDPDDFLERASHASRAADRTSLAVRELTAQQRGLAQVRDDAKAETGLLNTAREDAQRASTAVREKLQQAEELLATLTAKERARVLAAEAAEAAERAKADPKSEAAAQRGDARPTDPAPASGSARAAQAIAFARSQLGKPYGWGATGPDAYDCSGLTQAAWAAAGVALPRTSGAQAGAGTQVSRAELAPGDLVFYYSGLTHVALYIGGGQIVHAARSGTPVRVDPVDSMPFATATRPG